MEDVARRRGLGAALAVGYAGLLFWLSSRPADDLPGGLFPQSDKLVHAAAYAVLGALLAIALGGRRLGRLGLWLALGLAVAYGASDEWHQSFVPGRQPSLGDLAADTIGALAGILALARPWRREE